METAQVELDKYEAGKLYRKYREHRAYAKPADLEIQRIAKLVAEGKVVVQGVGSIVKAGINDRGLPKLAIARADAATCHLHMFFDGAARMSISEWTHSRAKLGTKFEFPSGSFPRNGPKGHYKAAVPHIPIDIRPKRGLENYHILFEAVWSQVVPVDPILIRRIGKSDLWVVLAAWELTPIERAVIASRTGLAF